jgi:hypothetical protein
MRRVPRTAEEFFIASGVCRKMPGNTACNLAAQHAPGLDAQWQVAVHQ